jgi:hypothetical protein
MRFSQRCRQRWGASKAAANTSTPVRRGSQTGNPSSAVSRRKHSAQPASDSVSRHNLRRERGPILNLSQAEQRGGGTARRVYRVEEKDMVELYTVSYSRDSRIDDIDLFSEY